MNFGVSELLAFNSAHEAGHVICFAPIREFVFGFSAKIHGLPFWSGGVVSPKIAYRDDDRERVVAALCTMAAAGSAAELLVMGRLYSPEFGAHSDKLSLKRYNPEASWDHEVERATEYLSRNRLLLDEAAQILRTARKLSFWQAQSLWRRAT